MQLVPATQLRRSSPGSQEIHLCPPPYPSLFCPPTNLSAPQEEKKPSVVDTAPPPATKELPEPVQDPAPGEPAEAPKETPPAEEVAAAPQAAAAGKAAGALYKFNVEAPEFKPSSGALPSAAATAMATAGASPSSQPREFVPSNARGMPPVYQVNEYYPMQPGFGMMPHPQGPPHEQWANGPPYGMRYVQQPMPFPGGPHGPFPGPHGMMMPNMMGTKCGVG